MVLSAISSFLTFDSTNSISMRILALNVEEGVAEAYTRATAGERAQMDTLINTLLREVVRKKQLHQLEGISDRIAAQAQASGLTPKVLGELMEWDKETMLNLFGEGHEQ